MAWAIMRRRNFDRMNNYTLSICNQTTGYEEISDDLADGIEDEVSAGSAYEEEQEHRTLEDY